MWPSPEPLRDEGVTPGDVAWPAAAQPRRQRWTALDQRWALALHGAAARRWLLNPLILASRLGDGMVWYALMLALPLYGGPPGWTCAQQMALVGAVNLLLYAIVKRRVGRPRPFVTCPGIRACTPALDTFSFPSGHTLHAAAYALLIATHYPAFAAPAIAFALLVALSRVVLGLHYPSDVLAGAAAGLGTASALLMLWRLPG